MGHRKDNENDANLIVQHLQLSEVAEPRGDGASELIRAELPEGARITGFNTRHRE